MQLQNHTLRRFIAQPPQVISKHLEVLSLLQPVPHFFKRKGFRKKRCGVAHSITELSFGKVNKVKRLLQKNTLAAIIQAIQQVYNISEKEVYTMKIVRFYGIVNFLSAEVAQIIAVEAERYTIEPPEYSAALEACGSRALQKFSDLLLIDALSQNNILNYSAIEAIPYKVVHHKIWMDTTRQNIQQRFNKALSKSR